MMPTDKELDETILDDEVRKYYCSAMAALEKYKVLLLVGGGFALGRYTGILRHTKDFEIF